MLKIAKNGLILHWVGSFGFSRIFFVSPPPPIRLCPRRGPMGTENFESPPIKNLEKKPCEGPLYSSCFFLFVSFFVGGKHDQGSQMCYNEFFPPKSDFLIFGTYFMCRMLWHTQTLKIMFNYPCNLHN